MVSADHPRVVGEPAFGNTGRNAGALGQSASESLAALSGAELPRLGAVGFLSIWRRLWIPGPIAGRDGAGLYRSGAGPRPDTASRGAPVQRRRRAALVASAGR